MTDRYFFVAFRFAIKFIRALFLLYSKSLLKAIQSDLCSQELRPKDNPLDESYGKSLGGHLTSTVLCVLYYYSR